MYDLCMSGSEYPLVVTIVCMQLHSKKLCIFAWPYYNDIHRSSELNEFLTGNDNANLYIHKCNEYTNKEKRDIAATTANMM